MEAAAQQAPGVVSPSAADKPEYTFRDMHLRVGDRAQVDPPPQTGFGRLAVAVVGWVEGRSLIVTAPHTPHGRLDLAAGEIVLLRAFTGRRAYAFRCTVLKRSAPPFEYLHLSFPDRIEGLDVRNAPRCRVGLPAKAAPAGAAAQLELTVENVSASGALLVAREPLGAVGAALRLEFRFVLHDVPVSLALACTIRSAHGGPADGEPCHRHGVSFDTVTPQDRLALSALVWFHTYENPRLAT